MEVTSFSQAFEWAYAHIGIVAWPTLLTFAWKASAWFNDAKNQLVKTVTQVDSMSTQYIPKMTDSLTKQDGHLESMDKSLKTMVDVVSKPAQFATAQTAVRKRKKKTR
jgi:hypothetical protein